MGLEDFGINIRKLSKNFLFCFYQRLVEIFDYFKAVFLEKIISGEQYIVTEIECWGWKKIFLRN